MTEPAPASRTTAEARAQAERWLDVGEVPAGDLQGAHALALAWALRDLCAAASDSDPQRASACAAAVRHILDCHAGTVESTEIDALMHWCAGMASIPAGDLKSAIQHIDQAGRRFREIDQALHAAQAGVVRIAAMVMLGQHVEAEAYALETQGFLVRHGDVGMAGKVSLALGTLHMRRHAYAQAGQHYREAAVLCARAGQPEASVAADIGCADALASTGQFQEALRLYDRARLRASAHGLLAEEARIGDSVAVLQLARGQYREALAGLETTRRRYEQLSMPWAQAITERMLAEAYLDLNLLPEAIELFERARGRLVELDMPDDLAWTLAHRGRAQAGLGDLDAADDSFRAAADIFEAQGIEVGALKVSISRAALSLAAGRADEALSLIEQATAGFRRLDLQDALLHADALRAEVLLKLGDHDQARRVLQATAASAGELGVLMVHVRCLSGLGQLAQAEGDTAAAQALYLQAVELFEDQRRALPGDDLRSAFLADHLLPYRELLRLALQAQASDPATDAAVQVLQRLDRFRARTLSERLNQRVDAGEEGEGAEMRARLNWLYRRVSQLRDEGADPAQLVEEMRQTERALLEEARRRRLVGAGRPGSERSQDADDEEAADGTHWIEALRDGLKHGEALVEYGVIDDELFACVVTAGGVAVQRHMASWQEVVEAVRAMRFQIDTLRHGIEPMRRHLDSLTARMQVRMERLHTMIWAPLQDRLGAVQRVLVVAHGALGAVPFAALSDGALPLGESLDLAIVPSARVAVSGMSRTSRPIVRGVALGESSRLPYAAQEAQEVAAQWPQGVAHVGSQATIANLQAEAPQADLLHLACHAQFRADNPMFSALHLSDGPLTVEAAERLVLKAATVVLSACETGVAEQGRGDEMLGLVRAFLVAGAARVVASQWPVDDATTAAFMRHFYARMLDGASPARALRFAQTSMRSEQPHPFFWSAFTLYGGW